ncbi:DUF5685 family protein [Streptomyces iconiensis]|uniref:DUF5685 family protein n=1 Tax=Streptomyces iconiensis TaxID=1384038 RepID=A0ABT6ZZE5_9ACTN|nr:DUF5685 family protein [Streptomyces iconiensis]MDJ1134416.1 DUF5685 family protein [Streptomyces iconiensis]
MFGIVRPCSHHLPKQLMSEWMAHLCGLCLALRGDHGQFARIVTNYDGLLVSVLTDAQSGEAGRSRRTAGPCPLRGMRTASVAQGEGARLAASVSLVLASAKVRDHIEDGDGALRRRPIAAAARRIAAGWDRAGAHTGGAVGFDTAVLVEAVARQGGVERLAGHGTPLTVVTEPTEAATSAAFAHTAHLAGRPGNAEPLAEAGRLFGRLAHLLDAVEDREADASEGAWNPLTATGTPLSEARRLCDDALHGIQLALKDVQFADSKLAHMLLVHELRRSVDRAFGTTACAHTPAHARQGEGAPGPGGQGNGPYPYGQAPPHLNGPRTPYEGNPYDGGPGPGGFGPSPGNFDPAGPAGPAGPGGPGGFGPGGPGGPGGPTGGDPHRPRRSRGFLGGCGAALALCCTCKVCCAEEYEGAWSVKKREGCCHKCKCCEVCECCECCACDC